MTLVAGVDSSTQGCKVVIVDASTGETVRSGRARHPDGTEVDPDHWWSALLQSIEDAGGIEDVSAISVAGQQHGMVVLDRLGQVIRPALLWNDTRSAGSAVDLIAEIGGSEVYAQRVGIVPVASFTASKLRWLRDAEPENADEVAAVALPHDWLTWRLMGYGPHNPNLEALVSDRSDASGTAYWSGERGEYDAELFEHALGRPMRVADPENSSVIAANEVIVPRIVDSSTPAGLVSPDAVKLGSNRVIVGSGTGDNAGGALGLGLSNGDVVVSLGTSGAVFSRIEGSLGKGDPTGVVACFASASGGHLPLVCTLNGARILEAGARLLRLEGGPADLTPLALAADPGSNGLVLLPYFEGERTPNLPTAKASLHNVTLANATPENMARACVESLMCSMAQAVNAINTAADQDGADVESETKQRRLLLIGGASVSEAVQEIAATVFNVDTIVVPQPGEYVARGAAFQAAWALGGKRPEWDLPIEREISCLNNPAILLQYESVQNAQYPVTKKETS